MSSTIFGQNYDWANTVPDATLNGGVNADRGAHSIAVVAERFANRVFNALFVSDEHSLSKGLYSCRGGSCNPSAAENMVDEN